ncbi:cobaltochelatase subunit CobN [Vibrio ostreae]|uniref:Cobaltochelatase subunit CobN n=1 Tax=Vibrio ostreae TaxID=2841925 RepID=A0A975U8N9_9VIBR|nr:cobaltochelatase subunit CobN [Vibrio ostreae]QXO15914.1 cobaltochelatase subunit CobN [Vibrio ostreae]
MRFLFVLFFGLFTAQAVASPTLFLLVSQRNAETIAQAAQQFSSAHDNPIIARSDTQWLEMSPDDRQRILKQADAMVGIGLFGASVSEVASDLQRHSPSQVMIFSSDHRLIQLSHSERARPFANSDEVTEIAATRPGDDLSPWLKSLKQQYPKQRDWLDARAYWQAGGVHNTVELMRWMSHQVDGNITLHPPQPQPRLQWWYQGQYVETLPELSPDKAVVTLIDHSGSDRPGDRLVFQNLCDTISRYDDVHCLVALASWGAPSLEAVQSLKTLSAPLAAIVMLQDFVIGGGEGREQATRVLSELNVPVLKALKLRDRTEQEWLNSSDGLASDKVYYQVSMPEIQGVSQPIVVATAGDIQDDAISGIRIQPISSAQDGIDLISQRVHRWHQLQVKKNRDKKIAIIYYNHPPGRHNIGADNLDVPASLWQILQSLQTQGYDVGTLPESQEALLDQIQQRGVNLPNDRAALDAMSSNILSMTAEQYQPYFASLPGEVQQEIIYGPMGRLHAQLKFNLEHKQTDFARQLLNSTIEEMFHLIEGVDHPGRARALALLNQLRDTYQQELESYSEQGWQQAQTIINALGKIGIEALGGWGQAPGNVMVHDGKMLLPGLQFGNIFIGPQPPRGWEVNEELLHANLAFPPPHQYLAFYHYLRDIFQADAMVHLGRHSTYEFLPHRSVGLAGDDYSRLIAADIPGVYPYIVDGVGEGIQAKRRGLAVMVDHLTPPLESTPLYDELLQLRQLIESYEANRDNQNQSLPKTLIKRIRDKVDTLDLRDELAQSMSAELAVMGISFEEVDDAMLVHEIGHYLTSLQEKFMPYGLHIFGKPWQDNAIEMMLASMSAKDGQPHQEWRDNLTDSPKQEMISLLAGLNGQFIKPGKGNDPIRSPESLPTGRNFYALDNSLIPSKVAWQIGQSMAQDARRSNPFQADKREAQVLWASDVVRDEGVMVAFALDMLGFEPVWNSRGLVTGLRSQALQPGRHRRDMVFTTSGLFRDLYAKQLHLLDQAVLLALDASADEIIAKYPALTEALNSALSPLGKLQRGGSESLQVNQVAAHWVEDTRAQISQGITAKQAAKLSTLRIFGDAPGSYGAGVNRLVERSGAWQQREELADVYLRRLGHAYTSDSYGLPAQETFKHVLSNVQNTYFGRSSNLYGLIDNNDAFDYLGGLSLAVESLSGQAPNNFVLNHADPENIITQPLSLALRQELRGRFLNPEWLQGLMKHGYAGARTMGSEFLEYLWGWQVTNPSLVGNWAWEEVKDVYLDDRYDIGIDEFLKQGHNVQVRTNMLAIMLVAINKGFWDASPQTIRDIATDFAQSVAEHGLPGSGHTKPDHPMMPWLEQYLQPKDWQALKSVLDQALQPEQKQQEQHSIKELTISQDNQPNEAPTAPQQSGDAEQQESQGETEIPDWYWLIGLLAVLTLVVAWRRNRHITLKMKGKMS